jgi:hypothetical protein
MVGQCLVEPFTGELNELWGKVKSNGVKGFRRGLRKLALDIGGILTDF